MSEPASRLPHALVWLSPDDPGTWLDSLVDEGPILLVVYLHDWTGVCTNEIVLLDERAQDFSALGVRVFGLSRDTPFSHRAWREVLDVSLPLVSDWNGDAVRALGAVTERHGMRDVPVRSSFLVDGQGIIRRTWRYEPSEVPDVDALLGAARGLATG